MGCISLSAYSLYCLFPAYREKASFLSHNIKGSYNQMIYCADVGLDLLKGVMSLRFLHRNLSLCFPLSPYSRKKSQRAIFTQGVGNYASPA